MGPVRRRATRREAAFRGALCGVLLLSASGCGADEPAARPDTRTVVVGSFDFPESEIVAEIYAQALEAAGLPVRREQRLGPRELVLPALLQGHVDVVPEYLGTALAAAGDDPAGLDVAGAHARLQQSLAPSGLRVLEPSTAQNVNALAVTRSTAEGSGLRSVSDLVAHGEALTLAAPPECPQRPFCLPGWQRVYGLSFARVLDYAAASQRVAALTDGLADVAVVFSTDGEVAARDLVLLADDRHLQPVENVVPVVAERAVRQHGEVVVDALNRLSAELDTAALTFLNWRVTVAGATVSAEARGFLSRRSLAAG